MKIDVRLKSTEDETDVACQTQTSISQVAVILFIAIYHVNWTLFKSN